MARVISFVPLLLILLVLQSELASAANERIESLSKELRDSLIKLAEKNTLGIGKICSVANERKRAELYTSIVGYINVPPRENDTIATELLLMQVKTAVDNFVKTVNGSLCNRADLLQCGANGTCVCAASGDYIGVSNLKVVPNKDKCRIAKGSVCGPIHAASNATKPTHTTSTTTTSKPAPTTAPDFKFLGATCDTGSTCVVKKTKKACTEHEFESELMKMMKVVAPAAQPKQTGGQEGHGNQHGPAPATAKATTHALALASNSTFITFDQVLKRIREGICVCSGGVKSTVSRGAYLFVLASTLMFRFV